MQRIQKLSSELTASPSQILTVETAGPSNSIAVLTMDSGRRYNSLSSDMMSQLSAAFSRFSRDPTVKVICLRSSHHKVFSAGANISEFKVTDHVGQADHDMFEDLDSTMRLCTKPIIVALNSLALGGGLEVVLLSDIILASDDAKIALPEITLGLFPGIGGTLITKSIGKHEAMKMVMTGERMTAQRAYELGLF